MFDESLLLGAGYERVCRSKDEYCHTFGMRMSYGDTVLAAPRILIGLKGAKAGKIEVYMPESTLDYFYSGVDEDEHGTSLVEKLLGSKYELQECDSIEKAMKIARRMSDFALKDLDTIATPEFFD